jgi:hypothetical protein
MTIRALPSVEYLRECFSYDPESGLLKWKTRPRNHFSTYKGWAVWNANNAKVRAGNVKPNGYRRVIINGVSYQEHRIIYKLIFGAEPGTSVDHIDGNPSNNKAKNLRAASHTEQKWNAHIRRDNSSGFRGVSRAGSRWAARINNKHLGCFASREDAAAVYETVARKLHGKFYRDHSHE